MIRAAAILIAVTAATLGQGQAQQQPTFRSSVQTVAVHATVKDSDGRLVPDLKQEQFQVFDNGRPVSITTFSNEIQPITVALLLDMSTSMLPRLLLVRDSTIQFINALLPHDRVRIGTFGEEISLSPLLTGDKAVLTRITREELWPGGQTPLWSAMYAAMESLEDETGRRVVLVLSDGDDSGSLPGFGRNFGDVGNRARRDGYMLYMIGMAGLDLKPQRKAEIAILCDETGGGNFDVSTDADLGATFARVADELRRQYLIGFVPASLDGRQHSLEVKVRQPGLSVRSRKSYFAARQ